MSYFFFPLGLVIAVVGVFLLSQRKSNQQHVAKDKDVGQKLSKSANNSSKSITKSSDMSDGTESSEENAGSTSHCGPDVSGEHPAVHMKYRRYMLIADKVSCPPRARSVVPSLTSRACHLFMCLVASTPWSTL